MQSANVQLGDNETVTDGLTRATETLLAGPWAERLTEAAGNVKWGHLTADYQGAEQLATSDGTYSHAYPGIYEQGNYDDFEASDGAAVVAAGGCGYYRQRVRRRA